MGGGGDTGVLHHWIQGKSFSLLQHLQHRNINTYIFYPGGQQNGPRSYPSRGSMNQSFLMQGPLESEDCGHACIMCHLFFVEYAVSKFLQSMLTRKERNTITTTQSFLSIL